MVSAIRRQPKALNARQQKLLQRLEQRRQLPMVLAPDFFHGSFQIDQAYHALTSPDAMAFVVQDDEGVAIGLYQDHFLSIHTYTREEATRAVARLVTQHPDVTHVMSLDMSSTHDVSLPNTIPTTQRFTSRTNLQNLEQHLFSIMREVDAVTESSTRLQNDVLSWIALLNCSLDLLS